MPLETPRTYVNLVFEPEEEARPRRRPFRHKRLIGGLLGLAALGLAGGFLLEPMLDGEQPGSQISAPVPESPAPAKAENLDIVVDDTPPLIDEPDVAPSAPTILPPADTPAPEPVVRADEAPVVRTPAPKAAEPAPAPAQVVRPASPPPAAPPRQVAEAPEVRPYTPTPPPAIRTSRTARPSFNCRYARTVSEQMICADPGLAALDRRMVRAYQQAIRRGIPEPELRRQQDIWLGVRESAARNGPEGVARAYQERTVQLQAMAR